MADLIPRSWYIFFSQPSESSKFIRENLGLKNVFSMASELATINVFSQFNEDEEKESNFRENKEEEKRRDLKPSIAIDDMRMSQQSRATDDMILKSSAVCDGMLDDMRMQLQVCANNANDDMIGMEGDMQDRANDATDDIILNYAECNGMSEVSLSPMVDDMRMRLQSGDNDATDDMILKSSDMIEISSVKGDTMDAMGKPRQSSAIGDKEMQQNKQPLSRFEVVSHFKCKLMQQGHGPNMDFDLLKDAYDNVVSASKTHFLVSDNAIFKQRTPLGNTVLHLAAGYGNDALVEKVAKHAPQLFTAVNNNYDTALHVAAKRGHGSTIKLLLNKFLLSIRSETNGNDHQSILEMIFLVSLTLFRNKQGNTFLHEAFITSSHNGAAIFQAFEAPFITTGSSEFEASFKRIVNHLATFAVNVEERSLLYMTIDVDCKQVVNQLLDFCVEGKLKPQGKSPLLPTLIKNNSDLLGTILSKRPDWMHLRNEHGWFPLHYAAFLGNLQCVSYLVRKCPSCTMERDNKGYLPIHLACIEGHVKIFQELLKWCLDPAEMVNDLGQNLLHVACESGNYEVVRYLLKHPKLEIMINQKDFKGNSPLHLATSSWHSTIVHALTWDNKVDLSLLNHDNQTALDIAEATQGTSVSLSQASIHP
ncbi:hypothetical protein K1719_038618 [Acacia pycnantha]|nr:hypothetical protein K1719_038618 [Acacia pycnantha]